ncbi:MAG: NUDIX domain-containing protein [Saprospiraceae bacterium]|nr:NUDIX domain-containing protein [Saprospiraceae bacterium]
MQNYIQDLRQLIGTKRIFYPAARVIIENSQGQILLIRRSDNGNWGLVAGGLEAGENITQCIIREAREETGLALISVEAIGISTNPDIETVNYPNGDIVQYATMVFYCREWTGNLSKSTEEATEIRFFDRAELPKLSLNEAPSIDWLDRFRESGHFIVE